MTVLLSLTFLVLMAVSLYAAQYLAHLPFAPECPACHCVTSAPMRPTALDRVIARMGGAARHCPRCGWSGRMRWRIATQRVSRD